MTEHREPTSGKISMLGRRAGGCTEASCSEGYTFSWPREEALVGGAWAPSTRQRLGMFVAKIGLRVVRVGNRMRS